MSMLFVASTQFTEYISSGKYTTYKAYQVVVGEFTPQATIWKAIGLRLLGRYEEFAGNVFGAGKKEKTTEKIEKTE